MIEEVKETETQLGILLRFLPECAALTLAPLLLRRAVLPTLALIAGASAVAFLAAHKASARAHEALKADEKSPPTNPA